MRYGLRSLMIVLTLAPPLLAALWYILRTSDPGALFMVTSFASAFAVIAWIWYVPDLTFNARVIRSAAVLLAVLVFTNVVVAIAMRQR